MEISCEVIETPQGICYSGPVTILLTNDDGIYAEGILVLYKQLKKIAHVTIVAPDSERSSVGHAITLAHPLWSKKIKREGRFFGHAVSGTPADCIKFGMNVILKKKPDLVISGINLGPNDGCSIFYSGTVAGAREGAIMGIPSMAVSLGTFVNPDFSFAARFSTKLVKMLFQNGLPRGTFLSVNIPAHRSSEIKGVRFTRQGQVPIHEEFTRRTDPHLRTYYWMGGRLTRIEKDINADTYALKNRYVTITPLHCDMTDYKFFDNLSQWKF